MSYACFIVDDEIRSISAIEKLVEAHADLNYVGSETDVIRCLDRFRKSEIKADIIFLDIEMPKLSGLEAQRLFSVFGTIVFVTAHPDFALQSYDLGVVDYMLKPVLPDRFKSGMDKVIEKIKAQRDTASFISVYAGEKKNKVRIPIEEIVYLESADTNTKITTNSTTYLAHHSMIYLENLLTKNDFFIRVHRSYLINLKKLETYSYFSLKMITGSKVPIGRKYRQAVKQKLGLV